MIGQRVYEQIRASSAVTALCKYVYPHVIPQDRDAPAITYTVDEEARDRDLTGQASYSTARVSLDVYDYSYADAHAIADALESALIDYSGTLGNAGSAIDCDHVRLDRRLDIFEANTGLNRVSLQFFFGYQIG